MLIRNFSLPLVFFLAACAGEGKTPPPVACDTEAIALEIQEAALQKIRTAEFVAAADFISANLKELVTFARTASNATSPAGWTDEINIDGHVVALSNEVNSSERILTVFDEDEQALFILNADAATHIHWLTVTVGDWSISNGDTTEQAHDYSFNLPFAKGTYRYLPDSESVEFAFSLETEVGDVSAKKEPTFEDASQDEENDRVTIDGNAVCEPGSVFWPSLLPYPDDDLHITELSQALQDDIQSLIGATVSTDAALVIPPSELWWVE
jgi:hypothetical protein